MMWFSSRLKHVPYADNQELYIDILRVVACFLVVSIHVSADYMRNLLKQEAMFELWIAYTINTTSQIAVPLFVLISGYLLLGRDIGLLSLFKKITFRILLPLFLFGSLCIIYWNWFYSLSQVITLSFMLHEFIKGPMMFHLWFMYMLAALYLLIPLLNYIVIHIQTQEIKYFFVLWLVFSIINSLKIIHEFQINTWFLNIDLITRYVPYFLAGALLKKLDIRINSIVLILVFILMIIITLLLSVAISPDLNNFNTVLMDGVSPTIIIASLSCFLLIKNLFATVDVNANKFKCLSIYFLSRWSFGVYLIHPILQISILYWFHRYDLLLTLFPLNLLLSILLVFISSLLITAVLKNLFLFNRIL